MLGGFQLKRNMFFQDTAKICGKSGINSVSNTRIYLLRFTLPFFLPCLILILVKQSVHPSNGLGAGSKEHDRYVTSSQMEFHLTPVNKHY